MQVFDLFDDGPRVQFPVLRVQGGLPERLILTDGNVKVGLPTAIFILVEVEVVAFVQVEANDLAEDGLQVALDAVVQTLAGFDALNVRLTEGGDFDAVLDDVDVSLDCRGSRIGCLCVWLGKLWPRRACS